MAAARARRVFALLALALLAPAATAAEIGVLFHTPEERMRLDRLRRGEPEVPVEASGVRKPAPTMTGFVRRSDGRHTVWIDGAPVPLARPGTDHLLDPHSVGAPPGDASLKIERKTSR